MADQIKELIEKINQEGVQAAEEKARHIESQAQEKARAIVSRAEAEAKKMLEDAREKTERLEASARAGLQQAGRDLILVLKKEIADILGKIVLRDIAAAVSAEELSKILTAIIKEYCGQQSLRAVVYLSPQDKAKLEGHFLGKLRDELKKGVELKAQDEIKAGFIISFDSGKSQFDFTDKTLAEYIGSSLKPAVAEWLGDKK